MSIKTDQAAAKMAAECQEKDYLVPFEEYLTSICTTDAVAEKILKDGRSLAGCVEYMEKDAIKRVKTRTGTQCVVIPPEEGFGIIREYFGITEADIVHKTLPVGVIDITDLL